MIDDSEWLMRRIPASQGWVDLSRQPAVHSRAFRPHSDRDPDGLSFYRRKSPEHPDFLGPQDLAARGQSPRGYYIALLRASDLHNAGIRLNEVDDDPEAAIGHCVLPDLNSSNRDSDAAIELSQLLADELTVEVVGPFPGAPEHQD